MIQKVKRTNVAPLERRVRTRNNAQPKGVSKAVSVTIRNATLNTTHVWHVLTEMQAVQIELLSQRAKRTLKGHLQQVKEMLEALPNQGDELLIACHTLLDLRLELLEKVL